MQPPTRRSLFILLVSALTATRAQTSPPPSPPPPAAPPPAPPPPPPSPPPQPSPPPPKPPTEEGAKKDYFLSDDGENYNPYMFVSGYDKDKIANDGRSYICTDSTKIQSAAPLVDDKCHCTESIRGVIDVGVKLETLSINTGFGTMHTVKPFESTKTFLQAGCQEQGCKDYLKKLVSTIKFPGVEHLADCLCDGGDLYESAAATVGDEGVANSESAKGKWRLVCTVPSCYDYLSAMAGYQVMVGDTKVGDPFPDVCKEAGDPRAENRPTTATTPYKLYHEGMKVDGDVSSFDVDAFKVKVAKLYRAALESISVAVTSGSVTVDITITYESEAAAKIVKANVGSMNNKALGALLGVTVVSTGYVMALEDKGPLFNKSVLAAWVIITLFALGFVVLLLCCVCLYRRRKRKRGNSKPEGKPKKSTTTTSESTIQASV